MLTISNRGIITVNRGDTFSIPLFINQGTELNPARYVLSPEDIVYLGVFKAGADTQLVDGNVKYFVEVDDEENETLYLGIPELDTYYKSALVHKTFTEEDLNENGDVVIKFTHEDTKFLLPGNYYYQIRARIVRNGEEMINTIVKKTPFIVLE